MDQTTGLIDPHVPVQWNPLGFPKTLILTEDALSPSHGTGACILRNLSDVPVERLTNAYISRRGPPVIPAYDLRVPEELKALKERIGAGDFDFIYSSFFSEAGLRTALEIFRELPTPAPLVIHHAYDIGFRNFEEYRGLLQKLSPFVNEFWGGEKAAANFLTEATGRVAHVMNPLGFEVLAESARSYRELGKDARLVMLGNVHLPKCFRQFIELWREMRAENPSLPAIEWYAHPATIEMVRGQGIVFEPDIHYAGFLSQDELHHRLREADVGLVIFNSSDVPENSYSRFSIPTRMAEYTCAGLPIFLIAGKGTDAARFASEHDIGVVVTLDDGAHLKNQLMEFLADTSKRLYYGRKGRHFAETFLSVERYRALMAKRMHLASRSGL